MKTNVYDMTGKVVGEVELSDAIFGIEPNASVMHDVVKVDPELNMIVVRGAIPGPKGGIVYLKNTVKTIVEKKVATAVSVNPQKQSGRGNPQKASARTR